MAEHPTADELLIRFPCRSGYLGISRLNATALAAGAGFDVVELDDVRQAVGEGVAWLLADASDGEVELHLLSSPGRLELSAWLAGTDVSASEPDDLVHAILGALTEQYRAGRDDAGRRSLHLVMSRSGSAPADSSPQPNHRP